ncbi:MAG TPA: DUF6055 domain-containing protein [Thermomicrobiales bacterium]
MTGAAARLHGFDRVVRVVFVAALLAVPVMRASAQDNAATSRFDDDGIPAQSLIGQQLQAGKIDYDTSLVYRAYALFGDARLPAAIAESGDVAEDNAFFGEVRANWPRLSDQTRQLLTPFIVRPTDTRSVFFQPGGGAAEAATADQGDAKPAFAGGDCSDNWAANTSAKFPFKVWVHCTGDYDADLDAAIAMIEDFWAREVDMMGPPVLDTGSAEQGGDTSIDFYFVEDESDRVDRGGGDYIQKEALAHAAPDDPVNDNKASCHVVARRSYIGKPDQTLVLAHEFYHCLQDAHNWQIGFGFKSTPYNQDFEQLSYSEFWFVEATATWVMSYLYRDTIDPAVMQNLVHYRFVKYFQGADAPLYQSPAQWMAGFDHMYAAYIYFMFLEQEVGADGIGQMWKNLENVKADDFTGTTEIIDEILPFKEHFRDFAVRNLNLDLEPGDPISPSYKDLDPTFPEGFAPPFQAGPGKTSRTDVVVTRGEPLVFGDAIPSLTAHYYDFSTTRPVKQMTLDFTGIAADGAVDVDMIAKIRGKNWERRQLSTDAPITFCFNKEADAVSLFYLVVSNHDLNEDNTARGSFTVAASDADCT